MTQIRFVTSLIALATAFQLAAFGLYD